MPHTCKRWDAWEWTCSIQSLHYYHMSQILETAACLSIFYSIRNPTWHRTTSIHMEISERYRDLIIDSFAWGPDLLRWRKEGTLFAPDPSAWFRRNIVRSQDPVPRHRHLWCFTGRDKSHLVGYRVLYVSRHLRQSLQIEELGLNGGRRFYFVRVCIMPVDFR